MSEGSAAVTRVAGTGCVLRGDEIDTDRIIPARFLRAITFDGLGEHAFADDREQAKGDHPLDDERFADAALLIVGQNFGCGSSREHAPQALMRRGFRGFIGGSFAEIFASNCTALGLPAATLEPDALASLMETVDLHPGQELVLDVEAQTVTSRLGTQPVALAEGARRALLGATWNATAVLLDAGDRIEATAARLPYLNGFSA